MREASPSAFPLTQRVLAALTGQIDAMLAMYSVENGRLSIFTSPPVLFLANEYPDGGRGGGELSVYEYERQG